jgi:hypothetical protein
MKLEVLEEAEILSMKPLLSIRKLNPVLCIRLKEEVHGAIF